MKITSSLLLVVLVSTTSFCQSNVVDRKPHKILMQFTTGDSISQASILLQAGNLVEMLPNASIEVVCHGGGLDLLTTTKSKGAQTVKELSSKGVVFAACNNTMKRRNLTAKDLLPQATVVPSAMVEMVLKEEQGWSYVKGAH